MRYPRCFHEEDSLAMKRNRRHNGSLLIVGTLAVLLEVLSLMIDLFEVGSWYWVGRILFAFAVGFLGWELIYSFSTKLEIPWYDSRAAAESIKTIFWRYLMQGQPFESSGSRTESEDLLFGRVEDVLKGLGKIPGSRESLIEPMILDWAWALRTAPLEERVNFYIRWRVEDQARWYETRSQVLGGYADRASRIAVAAVVGAFVFALGAFSFDAAGSWSEVSFEIAVIVFGYATIRNYRRDSRAYEFTKQEIDNAARRIPSDITQEVWFELVDEIEEVFSREHVSWEASHSGEIRR